MCQYCFEQKLRVVLKERTQLTLLFDGIFAMTWTVRAHPVCLKIHLMAGGRVKA